MVTFGRRRVRTKIKTARIRSSTPAPIMTSGVGYPKSVGELVKAPKYVLKKIPKVSDSDSSAVACGITTGVAVGAAVGVGVEVATVAEAVAGFGVGKVLGLGVTLGRAVALGVAVA